MHNGHVVGLDLDRTKDSKKSPYKLGHRFCIIIMHSRELTEREMCIKCVVHSFFPLALLLSQFLLAKCILLICFLSVAPH